MAEIGTELDHLSVRIGPRSIPTYDRSNREGMSQIMDARPTSMFASALRLTQAHFLGDAREVVARTCIGQPLTIVHAEECTYGCPEKPIPPSAVSPKSIHGA